MTTTLRRAARVVGTVTAALALTLTTAVTATAAPAQAPAAVRTAGGGDVACSAPLIPASMGSTARVWRSLGCAP